MINLDFSVHKKNSSSIFPENLIRFRTVKLTGVLLASIMDINLIVLNC